MNLFNKQFKVKIFLACVLMVIAFANAGKVYAQQIVFDPNNTLQGTLTAIASQSLEQKELIWDGLFFDIAQQALEQMTTDMLEWVNSGFDGEPVFVTNMLEYLLEAADAVAGDFIFGDKLAGACTPFKTDVIVGLGREYQRDRDGGTEEAVACTVDGISGGNQQAFLEGTFTAGGWNMWFETSLNPQNTPIGFKIAAKKDMANRIKNAQYQAEFEVGTDGIKPQKVCNGPLDCTIVTPGSIIKDQITKRLNIPIDRLLQADEMNEVIGALFGNLANEAVMGSNGLLGLGGNASFSANVYGSSGSLSYLDAVREERANTQSTTGGGGNQIEEALRLETQVLELQLSIVTQLDQISTEFLDARKPFENDSCWNLEFPESLSDELDELLVEVPETIGAVVKLEALLEAYTASDNTREQVEALQELSKMQRDGQLSGRTAVIQYDFYLKSELRSTVRTFREDIEDEINSC